MSLIFRSAILHDCSLTGIVYAWDCYVSHQGIPLSSLLEWQGSKSWGIVKLICPGHVTCVVSPLAIRQLQVLLIHSALNGGDCSASRSGGFTQGKNPGTHWIGGWVGPFGEEFNIVPVPGIETVYPRHPPHILVTHYTNGATWLGCTELARDCVQLSLSGTGWATVSFLKELDNIWTKRLWCVWGRSGIPTFDSRGRCVLVWSRWEKQFISTPWNAFISKSKIVAARRMVWEGHVARMRQFCLEKVKEDHSEELHVYGMIMLNRVGEWKLDWVGWG
jgi:hypothetical protein